MRPLAASWTVILPATISLTVCEMLVQSLKVTKGTFSSSHQVTKSVSQELAYRGSQHIRNDSRTLSGLCKQQIGLLGSRQIRDTVAGVEHGWPVGKARVFANLNGLVVAVDAVSAISTYSRSSCTRYRAPEESHLSSRKTISQPPSSLRLFPSRALTKLLTI